MALVQGITHTAVVTSDLDRLVGFYDEMFETTLLELEETPFGRVGIVRLGAGSAINIFEIDGNEHSAGRPDMFDRGHIDHFGLAVTDSEAFWNLRDRLVEHGHSTGEVTDFGPVLGFDFTDPDGMTCEVNLVLDPELAGGHGPQPYREASSA